MKEREGVRNRKILECTNRRDRKMKHSEADKDMDELKESRKKRFSIISDTSSNRIFNK
jgi:hypothetical protein